ncbi:PadR family transcriptional regulator [Trueperella sp. LYQ143]|uniref:PadR family transcriptional regulator n=1 Tax=Trueperella sp. LYQ143 TaxID=3391059 RepID=UPI003982F74E
MAESQLRKGALELIILGLLATRPSYGGELLERLKTETHLDISQGTVYPLLSRLHKAGTVHTRWEESPSGPPRKIYELRHHGHERLTALTHEWLHLHKAVTQSVKGIQL